jgi:hypothetical protein
MSTETETGQVTGTKSRKGAEEGKRLLRQRFAA